MAESIRVFAAQPGFIRLAVEIAPGDKSMVVNNSKGSPAFSVRPCNTAIYCQREVFEFLDEMESPVFLLRKQIATLHARCDGYVISSGDFETFGKKVISVSKNDIVQNHTDLNVKLLKDMKFLGMEEHEVLLDDLLNTGSPNVALITDMLENVASLEKKKEKEHCKIVGSWSKKSLTIYKLGRSRSSIVIAKVSPLETNDKFMVDVSSNVNCGFVISLIAAIDCMKDPGTLKHAGKAIGFVMKAAAAAAFAFGGQAALGLFLP